VADPERVVAGFARALRANGLSVPTGTAILFAEALALVGFDDPAKVYWAGRATLIRRIEDVPAYDRVFAAYWQAGPAAVLVPEQEAPPLTLALDDDSGDSSEGDDANGPEGDVLAVRYSSIEVLREQDLSALTPAEWAEAQRLISALGVASELRPSRRTRPSRRRARGHPDLRATLRRNMRTAGVPIRRSWRTPVDRPRRLVLLLDVSGSMEPYARGLARFAHAAVTSRRSGRVEVFTIGTRLTRITRELARRDPDTALAQAARSVRDWSGGTRLGESLQEFNDEWGVRGLARGAIVVICSDGWDRGDPALIGSEMRRLARVARRVVWVNPLKASPGYAPLARGMAAALPFVDQFVEGHAVSSLERLAEIIAGNQANSKQRSPDP
jgi:uncharacterized protein with von Willebrand factor type A (vWA) domain